MAPMSRIATAPEVRKSMRARWPWLRDVFTDGECAGPKLMGAMHGFGDWTIEIIKRSDTSKGFEVLPRRWVVERRFAWLGRSGRLAKDREKSVAVGEAPGLRRPHPPADPPPRQVLPRLVEFRVRL